MLCSLIMAGGKGTRFWPASTSKKPKQFLSLVGQKTMIQMTFDRTLEMMPVDRIFVVTCEDYKDLVKEQLPELPEKNIIIEPVARNTAPCILLSTMYIEELFPNSNVVVLSSDHMIGREQEFINTIWKANDYLDNEDNNNIITIGITPNRPETGYGYIKCKQNSNSGNIVEVEKFVEKPNLEKAQEYLADGSYLWNAGMFIFNTRYMLEELKSKFTNSYNIMSKLPSINDEKYNDILKIEYPKCDAISIDYAVMEKADSMKVIPNDLGWDDIGTWLSLKRYVKPDENNNYIKGNVEVINSKNNITYVGDKKVILYGVDNMFCINSDDVLIIGKNDDLSHVHELGKRNI